MKLAPPRRLADYVPFNFSEESVEREWEAIEQRQGRAKPSCQPWPWQKIALATAVFAALLIGLAIATRPEGKQPAQLEGAVFESLGASQIHRIALPEGSAIELGEESRVRVQKLAADETSLILERGFATFEVAPRAGRTFAVAAGEIRIAVKGTRFSVVLVPDKGRTSVSVSVERGVVEVAELGTARRILLEASESWSNTRAEGSGPAHGAANDKVSLDNDAALVLPESAPSASAAPSPREARSADSRISGVTNSTAKRDASSPAQEPTSELTESADDARELFRLAEQANLLGDAAGAARAFEDFYQRFPSDPRAGLAAFQQGRLKLDALADPAGALAALRKAISLGHSAPYREDAEARLVEAFERLGESGGCLYTKQRYLELYPNGTHRATVSRRCAR